MTEKIGKKDILKLATLAEEIGVKLSELASSEHDRIQADLASEYPDLCGYFSDTITLNAAVNSLANLVAVAIASYKDEPAIDHMDRVKGALHEMVSNLIGSDGGKAIFIKMPTVDEAKEME
jgi:hypothetical protein